jgi:hypothetical protein
LLDRNLKFSDPNFIRSIWEAERIKSYDLNQNMPVSKKIKRNFCPVGNLFLKDEITPHAPALPRWGAGAHVIP